MSVSPYTETVNHALADSLIQRVGFFLCIWPRAKTRRRPLWLSEVRRHVCRVVAVEVDL
jgi:hypothetical protein